MVIFEIMGAVGFVFILGVNIAVWIAFVKAGGPKAVTRYIERATEEIGQGVSRQEFESLKNIIEN